ncbi:hypothetical protein EZS27_009719 [termite gut metagenome]|uniref:DUF3256 family protein n=1 Tax=termite gut metagenome TaxID=433724 RepID=A0A5J4S8T0_9ZZZZ
MKKELLVLFMIFSVVSLPAQEIKKLFVTMPDTLVPLLTPVNRADFVDFLESNMRARVKNKFENLSEMTDLTPDYIRLQMTLQSTLQMKLLAINDTAKVICAVFTACAPECDSYIRFFATDWKELPVQDYLTLLPKPDDFFLPPDSAYIGEYGYDSMCTQIDMVLLKADLSKTDTTLSFTFITPRYMGEETLNKWKGYLREVIVYEWKDGRFQSVK